MCLTECPFSDTRLNLSKNNVTFVTFNYDRSLEYFLLTSIAGLYGINTNSKEAISAFSSIPIYHIYGKIGEIIGDKNDLKRRGYFKNNFSFPAELLKPEKRDSLILTIDQLRPLIDTLYVYGEKDYNPAIFKNTTSALQEADRIYFFGFGFNKQNLKILVPDSFQINPKAKFYGTCHGLNDVTFNSARMKLCEKFSVDQSAFRLENKLILEFLNTKGI
jgi:hypothetical protein